MNDGIQIIKPCTQLKPFVRYYWILRSDERLNVQTFPIGCTQIIFHRKSPLHIPELNLTQNKFTISGQVNFPSHIATTDAIEMIVVVFYPHTISLFIDTPPSEFYNSEISGFDLENNSLNFLASTIFNCENPNICIASIESWLLSKLSRPSTPNMLRLESTLSLMMSNPSVSIETLAENACLSQKQFGRIFNHYVGMMPKEYARIVRFQKSLWQLQNGSRDYCDIAYSCGYSDQSHFIREFKEYGGCTPSRIKMPYSDLFANQA